jgi:hypothetical protein
MRPLSAVMMCGACGMMTDVIGFGDVAIDVLTCMRCGLIDIARDERMSDRRSDPIRSAPPIPNGGPTRIRHDSQRRCWSGQEERPQLQRRIRGQPLLLQRLRDVRRMLRRSAAHRMVGRLAAVRTFQQLTVCALCKSGALRSGLPVICSHVCGCGALCKSLFCRITGVAAPLLRMRNPFLRAGRGAARRLSPSSVMELDGRSGKRRDARPLVNSGVQCGDRLCCCGAASALRCGGGFG